MDGLRKLCVYVCPHSDVGCSFYNRITNRIRGVVYAVIFRLCRLVLNESPVAKSLPQMLSILRVFSISRRQLVQDRTSLLPIIYESESQLGQELLAALLFDEVPDPYFVEAGACDGNFGSNTKILESKLGWTGILCEPARRWHSLPNSRSSKFDKRAIAEFSNKTLMFAEHQNPNPSTLDLYTTVNSEIVSTYPVQTVSLPDLVNEYSGPSFVHFLSLDTEGSEFDVLCGIDFNLYSFGFICVEHNNTGSLEQIRDLLVTNGYRLLDELLPISGGDAWFINRDLEKNNSLILRWTSSRKLA